MRILESCYKVSKSFMNSLGLDFTISVNLHVIQSNAISYYFSLSTHHIKSGTFITIGLFFIFLNNKYNKYKD